VLATSHFAQWVSENIKDGTYVVSGIHLVEDADWSSTPESSSGKVQMLDEREEKLNQREAMIERRLSELRNREKRLSAREASLEAKMNRYFLRHLFQYRRLLNETDDRLAFRKSASPGQS